MIGDHYDDEYRRTDQRDDRYARDREQRTETDVSGAWREELRAAHVPLPDGGRAAERGLPTAGDRVRDRDDAGDAELVVLEVLPDTRADEYLIDSVGATAAELNDEYPPWSPVVQAVYVAELELLDGSQDLNEVQAAAEKHEIRSYSFPNARLAPVDRPPEVGGDGRR